jgi:outer membrane protein TolC
MIFVFFMIRRRTIFIFILACATFAPALTEQEAVLLALSKNPDIRVKEISLAKDSIVFKTVKSDAGVQVVLSGNRLVEFHPGTRETYNGMSSTGQELKGNLDVTVSRHIPGGGNITASAGNDFSNELDGAGTGHSAYVDLSATQPLLKDAWGNSDIDYSINIEKKNLAISNARFRRDMGDIIAGIRNKYWAWILAEKTVAIRQQEVGYAESGVTFERSRFQVGEGTELDTLSAALELLRAREQLVTAEYDEKYARKALCLLLDVPPDSIAAGEMTDIPLSPLPGAGEILGRGREASPDLRVLALTREALLLEKARAGNASLPAVNLEAGLTVDRYGSSPFGGNNATSLSPNTLDPYIGIRFTYDILARRARLDRAAAERSLAGNAVEREYADKQLAADIESFTDAWHRDSSRLSIRRTETVIAEKNYTMASASYKLGTIDNLAMLKAKNDLINAQLNRIHAEINLKKLEIAVDNIMQTYSQRFGISITGGKPE